MHHAKAEINRAISQRQLFFMSTNKMAEIVDSEAAPVDTFEPEARLDDNDRRKLIPFYKEKPILWDTSLKLSKKAANGTKRNRFKRPRGALPFQLLLKTSSSSKLSIKRRICRNFTFLRGNAGGNADVVIDRERNVALKIVPCNMLLPQQCCVKSCLV